MKSSRVLRSGLLEVMSSGSVWLLVNRNVVSPAEGLLDGGEEPKVSVWFICQSLVRCWGGDSVCVGGDEVALGRVSCGRDVTSLLAVTSRLRKLFVMSAAVVTVWVMSTVKRSSAGVNMVRWAAAAVPSDVDADSTGRGSELGTEHYSTKKREIWFVGFSSCSSWR